jgi:hypothetical protein
VWILTLLACVGPTLDGTITNGLNGEPLSGFTIVAEATTPQSSMNCQVAESKVDEAGKFSLQLCSGTAYTVKADGDIFLPELLEIPAEGLTGPITTTGYRAPDGEGIYLMSADKVTLLKTTTSLARDKLPDGTEVIYPTKKLNEPPKVDASAALLLVGAEADRALVPLVTHAERIPMAEGALPPCDIAGATIVNGVATPATASPEAAKVVDITAGGRRLKLLREGALPTGRYAAFAPGDTRAVVVAF